MNVGFRVTYQEQQPAFQQRIIERRTIIKGVRRRLELCKILNTLTMEKRLIAVLSCLTVVWAHPEGVPLEYHHICQTMSPSHNRTAPKADGTAPFSINFNASCYDATLGLPINVTILATQATFQFIGFFVEARKPGVDSSSYGIFDGNGDRHIKTLNCFDKKDSAVCQYNPAMRVRSVRHAGHDHHEHAKWTDKTFKWTPPNDITDDLEFVGTVVKEYNEFWVGIRSQKVRSCPKSKSSTVHPSALLVALVSSAGALWRIHLLLMGVAL